MSKVFSIPSIRIGLAILAFVGAQQAAADFIDIHFSGGTSAENQVVFQQAKAFWESKLVGFVTPGDNHRLTIDASVTEIDGAGGILGQAGPTVFTTVGGYKYSTQGVMEFDSADYPGAVSLDVVKHEMGHILGIGTLWADNGLYVDGTGKYTGQYALEAWREEFNQTAATWVPVELGGSGGTADGHWDEVDGGAGPTGFISNITGRDFEYELMTGWANLPAYLSTVTLGSLRDMGYLIGIDYTDIYTGPAGGTVVVPNNSAANVRILEGGAGTNTLEAATTQIRSLTMSAGVTGATLNMGGNRTLIIGSGSGATGTVTLEAKAKNLTIGSASNDGFLTVGDSGASRLFFTNREAGSVLRINSVIRDNLGGGAVSVVVNGETGAKTVLGGANTYTGTTLVNGGTLVFASSHALIGAAEVASAGRMEVGTGTGGDYSTLLSFVSAVNNGVISTQKDGRINLDSATALTGGGLLNNSGLLGVSGVVTTTNQVVFNAGGGLLLANASSLLNVKSLTIGAGSIIGVTDTTGFTLGDMKTVAHADTAVDGLFTVDSALVAPSSNVRWISRTAGQDVLLGLSVYLQPLAGQTKQQMAVAQGLNDASLRDISADLEAEFFRVATLPDAQLNDALNRLSGHDRSVMDSVTQQHAHALGRNLSHWAQFKLSNDEIVVSRATDKALRATALGDVQSGNLLNDDPYGVQFFVRADHVLESKDAGQNGVMESDATGDVFTVGVHDPLSSDWNVGMAFTYDKTDVTSGDGLGESDGTTYGFDAYFSHLFDEEQRWYIAGDTGFGKTSYDNQRRGITPGNLTATSTAKSTTFHVSGELGCRLDVWQDARLTPYAGISYANNSVGAVTESLPGAPGLALGYEKHATQSTQTTLGADFAQSFDWVHGYKLTPSAGVAWHHQLGSGDNSAVSTHFVGAPGASFNTYLGTLSKDAIEIQGSLALQMPGGLKAFITGRHYQGMDAANKGSQDSIGAGLQLDF